MSKTLLTRQALGVTAKARKATDLGAFQIPVLARQKQFLEDHF